MLVLIKVKTINITVFELIIKIMREDGQWFFRYKRIH